ncbi:DnaJ subfamily C member 14 [Chionoecetes opilio]|uniref:DnaJ subfamily C member 14 n=1 Tax=Chionoecetes opilio TaxID=41210 RepID=A0A8J5CKN9_CHIOP|nr:DnaJ subfamily C member 14 [Chionoecetes opilio]
MMAGNEERWHEGLGATAGALGHLLERMTNDFTPQHDSQHYQPGFVPSASPPWNNAGQAPLTSLGSPMPSLQTSHSSLGSQISPLPVNHSSLGSQVPTMQSAHSNIGPQITPLQPATTSAPGSMPPGPQLTGSSARSYSVSQDLFSDLDGGRSPLLRSSSDLGLRLNHYHAQGNHYSDGRLDGFMDSSMDSLDGMLVSGPDSAFYLEVQRGQNASSGTPPSQGDGQGLSPTAVPPPEFSFYSHENDRIIEGATVNNISAKFSNFTASLGSWFSPFDPFRSNLTAAQSKPHNPSEASTIGARTESKPRKESSGSEQCNPSQVAISQPTKANKPSYSDVLSKNPAQEGKQGTTLPPLNSRSSSSNSNSSNSNSFNQQSALSPSPSPAASRPEQKTRGSMQKASKPRSSNSNNNGGLDQGRRQTSRAENLISQVGLDEFELDKSMGNGSISAYEHYDWGEYPSSTATTTTTSTILGSGSSVLKSCTSSPTHQAKKVSAKGDAKKNTPEKSSNSAPFEGDLGKGSSDQLNNKVSSSHQKQPPKRTSYINNILNASNPSSPSPTSPVTVSGGGVATNPTTNSPNRNSPISAFVTNAINNNNNSNYNNNESERSDGSKIKTPAMSKEDKKTQELITQGWAMAMQWMALAVRVMVWLGTLTVDVVVMSSRLFLHLLVVTWARLLEYWSVAGLTLQHYWTRLTGLFSKREREEKKLPGRDKKLPRGLDINISLPTTGDEAMKRLLACKGKDPYSILGVTQDCTDEDIKKYYKRQAFLVHPDKNKQPGAEEAFKILAHAFEIIGEPERRREYDVRLAEEVQLEGAWGELASLLTQLQEKLDEAANTIRCTNCNKRHRRVKLSRPIYAARHCAECQIHHAAREVAVAAAKMAIRCKHHPLPLPLSTVKRLKSRVCCFTCDTSLGDALRPPTMGHCRSDSSLHPWIRETSCFLDVSLTRLWAAATQHSRPACTSHQIRTAPGAVTSQS